MDGDDFYGVLSRPDLTRKAIRVLVGAKACAEYVVDSVAGIIIGVETNDGGMEQ